MGKSLVPLGGQNPLEAARLDCAIVHGPHMMNFEDITERLKQSQASIEAADETALELAVALLLDDPAERNRMAARASDLADAEAGVLDALMAELKPFLDSLPQKDPTHAGA